MLTQKSSSSPSTTTATTLASNRRKIRLAQNASSFRNGHGSGKNPAGPHSQQNGEAKGVPTNAENNSNRIINNSPGTLASNSPLGSNSTGASLSAAAKRRLARHSSIQTPSHDTPQPFATSPNNHSQHVSSPSRHTASDPPGARNSGRGTSTERRSRLQKVHDRYHASTGLNDVKYRSSRRNDSGADENLSYSRTHQNTQQATPEGIPSHNGARTFGSAPITPRRRARRSRALARRGESREDETTGHGAVNPLTDGDDSQHIESHEPDQEPKLALNLHVTGSVDSDDNGTCFNSIGTTTPRQPSPSSRRDYPHHHSMHDDPGSAAEPYQPHLHEDLPNFEERSPTHRPRILSAEQHLIAEVASPNQGRTARNMPTWKSTASGQLSTDGPTTVISRQERKVEINNPNNLRGESIWDRPEEMVSSRYKSSDASIHSEFLDDVTPVSYGHNQDGGGSIVSGPRSNGSVGGERVRAAVSRGRFVRQAIAGGGASVASSKFGDDGGNNDVADSRNDLDRPQRLNPLTEEETDVLEKPSVKAALGVGAAATLGAAIFGPVGLLVGVASAGIGMGVMQIPEEHRNNVCNRATSSLERAKDMAWEVSDSVSTSCGKYYGQEARRNPSDVIGKVVHQEVVDRCCSGGDEKRRSVEDGNSLVGTHTELPRLDLRTQGSSPVASAVSGVGQGVKVLVGDVFGDEHPSPSRSVAGVERRDPIVSDKEDIGRRVACGRKGRVVPLSQIHSLRPSLQPRAWLDVMASAHTSREDKNEAMEELLILAKDKEISRWFLEEGILDSLMFILSSFFRNYSSFQRGELPLGETNESFSSFRPGGPAFLHAKLAAHCCVALGKAHCAAVHTEGDLLLMSAYRRGSVPVERQLAQMLFEVPHHMKVMNPFPNAGTNEPPFDGENFTLTELSMQQAEDLASSIKALDDGKVDV